MFDLNDIWRVFVSDNENKRPSEWRSKVRTHLNHTANLRVGHSNDSNGYITNHTWATLEALYAYAMWVDVEFYMVVVEAFAALTRGETDKAEELANEQTLDASRSLLNEPLRSFQLLNNTLVATDAEPILESFLRAYRLG